MDAQCDEDRIDREKYQVESMNEIDPSQMVAECLIARNPL